MPRQYLDRRIEALEEKLGADDEKFPIMVARFKPWCSAGCHSLPLGYLRGYSGSGYAQRKPVETEEELYERALAIAKEQRGPRCGIVLVEDRESVPCTQCSGSAN